jgi:hypothetical protein
MAPAVLEHPEARPPGNGVLMAESSLARPAQGSTEMVECFRHEGEECPRCDGSGFRPRKHCAGCGEPSGRPSEGGDNVSRMRPTVSSEVRQTKILHSRLCQY